MQALMSYFNDKNVVIKIAELLRRHRGAMLCCLLAIGAFCLGDASAADSGTGVGMMKLKNHVKDQSMAFYTIVTMVSYLIGVILLVVAGLAFWKASTPQGDGQGLVKKGAVALLVAGMLFTLGFWAKTAAGTASGAESSDGGTAIGITTN